MCIFVQLWLLKEIMQLLLFHQEIVWLKPPLPPQNRQTKSSHIFVISLELTKQTKLTGESPITA